jgi:uncharacterized membrane protein
MPALALLLILVLVFLIIVLPIWSFIRAKAAQEHALRLQSEVLELQRHVARLGASVQSLQSKSAAPLPPAVAASEVPPRVAAPLAAPAPVAQVYVTEPAAVSAEPTTAAPPAFTPASLAAATGDGDERDVWRAAPPPLPPVVIDAAETLARPAPSAPVSQAPLINWELFMGVKLAAWIGGLALFLAVAFFVKYSFEHNLIPPEVRVAIGFLIGVSLVAGGVRLAGKRYAVTAQTLCASGVVSLYAVTFVSHAVYRFPLFSPLATFALMALVTATAFLLAVRMEARVVAVLGILGGFLTPALLGSGEDNPLGLFGYLALLDVGLIAVALHRQWRFLVPLGGAGTLLLLLGWTESFFVSAKVGVAMSVCLGFGALFTGAVGLARRRAMESGALVPTALAAAAVAFGYAFYFLGFADLAERPGLLFGFVLGAELLVVAVVLIEPARARAQVWAGWVVFGFLACWTQGGLRESLLPWALGGFLGFAGLHTALPLVLRRLRPEMPTSGWSQLAAPLALLLVLGAVCKFSTISWLVWPCVLLIDVLAIALAFFTASLAAVAGVLVLTLVALGAWVFRIPVEVAAPGGLLLVLAAFALLFFGAGLWLCRRTGPAWAKLTNGVAIGLPGDPRAHLPALSALLPFTLLIMVVLRLPLASPSPVFGLALLLVVLALGLARLLVLEWLPAAALVGVLGVQWAWLDQRFTPDCAVETLVWLGGFYAIFALFPFVFRRVFAGLRGPWVVAALAAPAHFWLVYQGVERAFPNPFMGLLPALFVLPALASLVAVLRGQAAENPLRLGRLAWFGGVALLFITLIFPIQFSAQWLTLGWALEGAALLWLFHRVPHPGLQVVGVGLLAAVFVRLALNPSVLGYHASSATPIFNVYLGLYGVAIACFVVGARLLAPPRDRVMGIVVTPWLLAGSVILAFLLLNIEIADFFSEGDAALVFRFSGNLARDMTYTIAWALFAFGLLVGGIWKKAKPARYAALALLGAALLKLFFHDLAHLGQLYRIGALAAVAVIAILASFVYQRFLATDEKSAPEVR